MLALAERFTHAKGCAHSILGRPLGRGVLRTLRLWTRGRAGNHVERANVETTRLTTLPSDIESLASEADAVGLRFLQRLIEEWAKGTNRFDGPGELFLAAAQLYERFGFRRISGEAVTHALTLL